MAPILIGVLSHSQSGNKIGYRKIRELRGMAAYKADRLSKQTSQSDGTPQDHGVIPANAAHSCEASNLHVGALFREYLSHGVSDLGGRTITRRIENENLRRHFGFLQSPMEGDYSY
jgi:hypothetical protein